MAKASIVVVDDEEDILELVSFNLKREGYSVRCAHSGEEALKAVNDKYPDLVILDLMLPGLDGLEVCRMMKGEPKTRHIPVIMLTAKGEESDVVAGLELGADDYVTKPFSPKVLIARVRSVLRKRTEEAEDKKTLKVGDLLIDAYRHEVRVGNKPVELTLTEFNILHTLARRPGVVFTRYQIVDAIHGVEHVVSDRAVDVQIVSLRRKLGKCGKYIQTVRGIGYRFEG